MPSPQTPQRSAKYAQLLAQRPEPHGPDDVVYLDPDQLIWAHVPMSQVKIVCDEHDPDGDRHVTLNLSTDPSSTRTASYSIPLRARRDDILLPQEVQGVFDRQEARWLLSIKKQ